MGQNQQPQGQMVSGRYVAPSFFQNLQPIANMLTGAYMAKQGDTQQQQLAEAIRNREDEAMKNLINVSKGTPAQQGGIFGPNGQMTQATTADMYDANLKLNPLYTEKATIEAKPASQEDMLLAAMKLRDPSVKNMMLAERFKPKTPITVAQGAAVLQQNPDNTYTNVFTNPKEVEHPASYKEYLLAQKDGFKGTYNDYQTLDANRKRPITNVTTNVMGGENEYNKTFGKELATQDMTLIQTARNAPQILANNKRQLDLLNGGNVITGVGANQRLDLARFGQAIGVGGKGDIVANTQQLLAGRAGSVLDSIKASGLGAGNGFSNADRDFLEKAKLGGITYDATALKRQIEIENNVTKAMVGVYNQRIKDMPIAGNLKLQPVNVGTVEYLGPAK
jgi:hypothetical protein